MGKHNIAGNVAKFFLTLLMPTDLFDLSPLLRSPLEE